MLRCPVCNADNPESARFCNSCGNRLPERRTTGTSERKVVTVLFCDVKGSTALAEKLDPEDWTEVIDGAFRILTPPIQRYGGTVARLLGDAVLAFFGAPVAHEDDPERAVRAGLEMLQATGTYRERLVRERGPQMSAFDIRVGINTGLAVIGDVGSGQAVEYTGMGDAVNVAARLQAMADPGTMVVSGHTLKLVPPVFEQTALGELDLKGREGKLAAYVVRGLSGAGTRPRGTLTPLVGRERELGALREALREVRQGGGTIISLVGDAGLGKTRLIEELRREWDAAPVEGQRWTEARGQSYEQTRSYGLVRQHLLCLAGVTDADPPETIRARVTDLLPASESADEAALRTLDVFLDVAPAGSTPGPEGQELRDRVHALMRRIATSLAAHQAVFVFDDLQWSDAASADLLAEIFDLADQAPVLFVLAFRPDRQAPSWRIKQKLETDYPHRYVELALPQLTPQESARLLDHSLGDALPQALRARVLDRAEGNPFFLEEIVRSLVDDGTVAHEPDGWRVTRPDADVRLPDSLQAVLAARIDRLEAESRETLQAAAVIGRTFLYRVLSSIREASDKLDRQLLALQRLELVREQAREPEREFAFRHALTQEAAYGSILQRKRRELHLRVGEALEALFPERAEEFAAVLGHHYAEAMDPRALGHLKAAGERAVRLHALEEAETHYRRAISLLGPESEPQVVSELHVRYGRVFELRGDYGRALEVYRELERVARERGDAALEGAALSAQMVIFSNPTPFLDPEKASQILERQIALAKEREDRRLLAKLLWSKAQTEFWRGNEDAGIDAARESEALARETGDKEQLAFTLNSVGQLTSQAGRTEESGAPLRESIALFEELGNDPMVADGWSTLAFTHFFRGELEEAGKSGMRAFEIADSIANDWGRAYALFTPSFVWLEQGDWGRAIETFGSAIAYGVKGGFVAGQIASGSDLGLVYAQVGAHDRARERLDTVMALAREKLSSWYAWPVAQAARAAVLRGDVDAAGQLLAEVATETGERGRVYLGAALALARSEHALATGDVDGAARQARAGRAHIERRRIVPLEKDFDLALAEAMLRTGDHAAARAAAERGIAASRQQGSTRLLWRLLGVLAAVAQAEGRVDDAGGARDEAEAIVERIARSLRAAGLEDTFRGSRSVRGALGLREIRA